jgi:hypothetical protein
VSENKVRRQLNDEEIYDLYSSPNVIRVIKSRRMNWKGQVAHRVERRGAYRVLADLRERSQLRNLYADGI